MKNYQNRLIYDSNLKTLAHFLFSGASMFFPSSYRSEQENLDKELQVLQQQLEKEKEELKKSWSSWLQHTFNTRLKFQASNTLSPLDRLFTLTEDLINNITRLSSLIASDSPEFFEEIKKFLGEGTPESYIKNISSLFGGDAVLIKREVTEKIPPYLLAGHESDILSHAEKIQDICEKIFYAFRKKTESFLKKLPKPRVKQTESLSHLASTHDFSHEFLASSEKLFTLLLKNVATKLTSLDRKILITLGLNNPENYIRLWQELFRNLEKNNGPMLVEDYGQQLVEIAPELSHFIISTLELVTNTSISPSDMVAIYFQESIDSFRHQSVDKQNTWLTLLKDLIACLEKTSWDSLPSNASQSLRDDFGAWYCFITKLKIQVTQAESAVRLSSASSSASSSSTAATSARPSFF